MRLGVFDFGKTNHKFFVFDRDLGIISDQHKSPLWREHMGLRVLDDAEVYRWMTQCLIEASERFGIEGVTTSAHGCTFALIDREGLVHPILDYEQDVPEAVATRIDPDVPPYTETYSPILPLGINFGRHLLWLADEKPEAIEQADAILGLPQYWGWRLGGAAVSERSYFGCHSHLWAPLKADFSSLVDQRDWRKKLPEFQPAGAEVGEHQLRLASGEARSLRVYNGVHDSNASLHLYRAMGFDDLTVVSTGTWVIVINTGGELDHLRPEQDMLLNVAVDGRLLPTIRFMGGREFDVISRHWRSEISPAALCSVIAKSAFALPSFAPGGPHKGTHGQFVGPELEGEERAALAILYVALMTDLCLDLIGTSNPIIVDGGLGRGGLYAGALAALRPQMPVFESNVREGTATGAAALAFGSVPKGAEKPNPATPAHLPGLADYRRLWRELIADQQTFQQEPKI
jgi:sugar (pentulose or hexulose) kinase